MTGSGRKAAKKRSLIVWIALLLPALGLSFLLNRTIRENATDAPGYTPLRDDAIARRYAPILDPGAFGSAERLLYRMARGPEGNLHVVYHFIWPGETNDGPGLLPLLNRMVYSGGLHLQKTIFGPGDIELVQLEINATGQVTRVRYETPDDHDAADFSVRHRTVELSDRAFPARSLLRVVSWNHLFEYVDGAVPGDSYQQLEPAYFDRELWEHYEMFKLRETFLARNRAHADFERIAVD